MDDPITRVFTLLEILQTRDHVSGTELAGRLGVDLRTVQRYMVRLKDLGIPVASSPGVGGAYRLKPGFRLPPLLLTNEEAFALALGLHSLRQLGLSAFAPATEGALAKLGRVLPATLRESLHTVEEVVAIEPGPWIVPTSVDALILASSAIRSAHRLSFCYRSRNEALTQREIEPYGVLHTDGRWYLIGRCLTREALRTFRLDRTTDVRVGATTFEPPAAFDARAYLAAHMPFVSDTHQIDIWIDMPKEEAATSFAFWRVSAEPDGNGTRIRCSRETLEEFAAMMLSINRRIIVHSPPALRDTFRLLAEQALLAATEPPASAEQRD